jgi:5-bromo-4-chloroindolyl phosphate hydrolysis protein
MFWYDLAGIYIKEGIVWDVIIARLVVLFIVIFLCILIGVIIGVPLTIFRSNREFEATKARVKAQQAEAAQRAKDNDRNEYAVRKRLNEERSKPTSFYKEETKEDKPKDWLSAD